MWNLKKADWTKYTEMIESNIPSIISTSPSKLEEDFRRVVTKAANKYVVKKKKANKPKPFMTDEIKQSIRQRNVLRKTRTTNRREWNESYRTVAALIKAEKVKAWKDFVAQIDMRTNPKQVWRTIRSMDGKLTPQKKNEVLIMDGIARVDDKDKSEAFAKTYRKFSKLPTRKADHKLQRSVRKRMKKKPSCSEESEKDISMREMERVINQTGNFKAAGEDEIPYELIKKLGPKAKELLLRIYNMIWANSELPRNWRAAVIRPLLKDGKDPELTSPYRPISLTACLGKILENIIADRLAFILEDRRLITNNQAGFRQGRCTTDQILKLTQSATDQIHQEKGGHATFVTFFDYEKAYDKVWIAGLLHELLELHLPMRYIRYVRHFLNG